MRIFEGFQKGINLGGWLSQCVATTDEHFASFITEQDIAQIASWGLDHVRLPIDYDIVFADQGNTVHPRMQYVDDCIAWCEKYGLHLLLDLHRTCGYMFDTDVEPDPDKFFNDAELQDVFVQIWLILAKRYGNKPQTVAFELLNEVTNPEVAQKWNAITNRTIEAIRPIAPDTYILVGGCRHNAVVSVPELDPPHDDHIVYNFHCYEPLVFTHQRASWVRRMPKDFTMHYPDTRDAYAKKGQGIGWGNPTLREGDMSLIDADFFDSMFQVAVKVAQERGVALYCGEYGVIDQAPTADTVNWLRDINSVFVKYGIGRSLWTYKQRDFGLVDEHYADVKDEMIKYL